MSNSKNAIQEIKKLMVQFGFLTAEPTLLDFKLEDKTILQAEALEVGKSIFKINEQFERVALEDGSYVIPNEFQLEVSEGKIATVKEIFVDAKLKDGTDVSIKGPGVSEGAKVFVIKDGVPTPAPDDVHELEDGTKITTKDGEIVSIDVAGSEESGAEVVDESPAEEGMEPVSPVEEKSTEEIGKLNPEMMGEMYDMLKDFVVKCGQKMAEMEGQYNALQNEFEAFKKEPAGQKIKYAKTDNFNAVENELDSKIANILSLRKNKK